MSTSVNEVTLIGRLGRDPEIRYTQSGTGVANLALATDESWKDKKSGEKQTRTEWHKLVSWISIEFIEKYLHKGDMIFVKGKIQTREWEDKDGQKRSTTEINVLDIKPLVTQRTDSQPAINNRAAQTKSSLPAQNQTRQQQQPAREVQDEDIPF